MIRGAVILSIAAALAVAAPSPDQSDNNDPTRYNGVPTSYGVAISPAHAAAAATSNVAYEPQQYENAGYGVQNSYNSYYDQPEGGFFPGGPISAVAGYKLTAVGFVVKAIGWLIVHSWAIVLGAVATFAFCKTTRVCDLTYHKYAAETIHESVRSLMTPERIASASRMFDDAMKKYSGDKKKAAKKN